MATTPDSSAEDLHRTGVTSIPDALRMAPGVEVAQTGAHTWAISVRGFNSGLDNKLLVMIDGRSVYTPIFAVYEIMLFVTCLIFLRLGPYPYPAGNHVARPARAEQPA